MVNEMVVVVNEMVVVVVVVAMPHTHVCTVRCVQLYYDVLSYCKWPFSKLPPSFPSTPQGL